MDTLTLINQIEDFYGSWGNSIVFISTLIETLPIGFLIPGGLILSLGGFFSYGDKVGLSAVILSGTFGMLFAFLIGYFVGRKTGNFLIKKFHQEKNAEMARTLLNKHGAVILTTSLLANLTRFWIAYVAGTQRFNFFRFIFYAFIASLTWTSLFAIVGYLAGSERGVLEIGLARLGILSYGIVILALVIISWSIKKEYELLAKNKNI